MYLLTYTREGGGDVWEGEVDGVLWFHAIIGSKSLVNLSFMSGSVIGIGSIREEYGTLMCA